MGHTALLTTHKNRLTNRTLFKEKQRAKKGPGETFVLSPVSSFPDLLLNEYFQGNITNNNNTISSAK